MENCVVPVYPPERVFSVDVECVAVGRTHEPCSRAACSVSIVDGWAKELYRAVIRPEQKVISYLTPITGVTAEDLEFGISLAQAISEVKDFLRENAVIVGQKPDGDLIWLDLQKGVDFAVTLDLAEVFKGFNPRYGNETYHNLQHEARVLLNKQAPAGAHDPCWDATVSVELYNKAKGSTEAQLAQMRNQLINERPLPSIAKQLGYNYEGVCMARFMPRNCMCGAPCG